MVRSSVKRKRRTRVRSHRVKRGTLGKARPRRTARKKRKSLRGGLWGRQRSQRRRTQAAADEHMANAMPAPQAVKLSAENVQYILALITFLKFLSIVYDRGAMNNIVSDMHYLVTHKSKGSHVMADTAIVLSHAAMIFGGVALTGGLAGAGAVAVAAVGGASILGSALAPKAGDYVKKKMGYGQGNRIAFDKMGESDELGKNHIFRSKIVDSFYKMYPNLSKGPRDDKNDFHLCVDAFSSPPEDPPHPEDQPPSGTEMTHINRKTIFVSDRPKADLSVSDERVSAHGVPLPEY